VEYECPITGYELILAPLLRMSFVLVFPLLIHISCYCVSEIVFPMPCPITEAHDLTPSVDSTIVHNHGNGLLRLATAISDPLGISGQPAEVCWGCEIKDVNLDTRTLGLASGGQVPANMIVGKSIPKSSRLYSRSLPQRGFYVQNRKKCASDIEKYLDRILTAAIESYE
jgi:hypothetical protein